MRGVCDLHCGGSIVISPGGQESGLDRDGGPRRATTNAEEQLLSLRHIRLCHHGPREPGNGSMSRAASTAHMLAGHCNSHTHYGHCQNAVDNDLWVFPTVVW